MKGITCSNHGYLYYDDEPLIGYLDHRNRLVVFIDYIHTGYFSIGKKPINTVSASTKMEW